MAVGLRDERHVTIRAVHVCGGEALSIRATSLRASWYWMRSENGSDGGCGWGHIGQHKKFVLASSGTKYPVPISAISDYLQQRLLTARIL